MRRIRSDDGSATTEWTYVAVAVVGMAVTLYGLVTSSWFERQLYRPFELALGWLF